MGFLTLHEEQGLAGPFGKDAGQVLKLGDAGLELLQQGPGIVVEGGRAGGRSLLRSPRSHLDQRSGIAEVGDNIGGHGGFLRNREA